ncbi:hypothetical protein CR205_02130 [Alteribacter lacisalsi]|uniref:Uncharacterized protein n=1 Tax=Alteribacter lacisalsi TaxID=2045244 RepID=A0A2W0HBM9_9BACI|nr:hypothetical protein [Alteribacter lacisalsi]PYZ97420.1 hypothetical protein CR205_02130 [Alteribacter lacisalsi]
MEDFRFKAEFQDLFVRISKPMLKTFIHKLLQADFRLTWRYEEETVELLIKNDQGQAMIPIRKQENEGTAIVMEELQVDLEEVAILLEELITEGKGRGIVKTETDGWIYVSCFDNGKIVSVMKIGGGEREMSSYRTIRRRQGYKREVDPEVMDYVLGAEIDYSLMELFEAMEANDAEKCGELKEKLRTLAEQRNELHQED